MDNENNNEQGFVFYHEPDKFEEHNKKPKNKKGLKIFGTIAITLAIALSGGLIGGLVTYKTITSKLEGKTVNLAPVNFTQSDEKALSAQEVYQKVSPAVVTISTKGTEYKGFFAQNVEGIGSGFIINEDGYILTNYHVVELAISNNTKDVTVILSNGEEVAAKVVNYDQNRDIAMVKLADGTKVPAVAELGDSDGLYVGQEVVAIGTPLGKNFAQTLTKGIVSGVNRNLTTEGGNTGDYIQTDAAINSGNSGGPLINTKGEVIGINTAKLSGQSETTIEGMGFAIPINDAKDRIESLSKPILNLGITVREVNSELAKQNNLPKEGLWVVGVTENSPAAKAGIQPSDLIIKFDGKEVKTFDELSKLKSNKNAGDKVEVVVYRNGKNVSLSMQLAES
ncbi:trypsin-like peptidase domain-containing protein [Clostridium paraputrificum]|uniref:S1C family serine protease n=1 Tax=Clostridium TaxID=1485 RepID=UPI00232FB298|nr:MULTISPECIES: trypsin-like peptidase domain-containing protein [Clostridium]MDB2090891.1 trypsin-like peptidase domain-containing protein [Clostridium paraputrificum]MDB2097451.1 trypsin-like peptidase domain-containing protein [Clostridium paraputrificum]MDU1180914.1 trypsin-like peptidase domain-containing protein [Clostridium sp.]MDU1227841.1 trypsin-like peptidase domain-containing protein [Clostridium sp.]MDU4320639.1 trypsin-like peptidase domain-containing protein [Clostridium sp.]